MGNCFQRLISRTPNPVANKSISSALVLSSEENQLHSQYHSSSELSPNVATSQSNLFTVDTWAGDGIVGTRDGTGKDCSINWPYEIKFDKSGNGFFTAYGSASVRKITPQGKVTTVSDRLSETGETFHCVRGLALDKKGNIYVADTGNNAIRKITAETGFCETIVTDMVLSNPYGITVADDGMIYVSDTYADRIVSIQPENGHCQVIAGTVNGYLDGNGKTEARFSLPQGLIMDPAGNLIVADSKNNAIRKIDLKQNGQVTTVAKGFQSPYGVAMDKKGNIFVSDYGNSAIQVIDLSGNVRPVAGELNSNYSDFPKTLKMPTGIDIDPYGNIVICDCYNHVLRRVNCVFVQMADVWPKSHRYLPRDVSRATEELHCILAKSPPVPLPKELILIMVKNLIEVWPFP